MAEQFDNYTEEDARVDDYVRGKMTEDEEIAFEAEFIANPALFEKVELMSQLRDGLEVLNENNELVSDTAEALEDQLDVQADTDTLDQLDKVQVKHQDRWFKYFAVPQTAWGAFAASVVLLPLLLLNSPQERGAVVGEPSWYSMESGVRSSGASLEDKPQLVNVDENSGRAIFEFSVDPFITAPPTYRMRFTDAQGRQLWQKEALSISADLKLYVEVDVRMLDDGVYYFDITEVKSSGEKHTRKGIEIRHRG